MTTDNFTEAARAVGADPEDVRESMRNATEYASRNGLSDAEFMLWIWHAGAIYGRTHLAAQETDGERAVRELHRQFGVYEHEDDCPDTSDEHREAHHHGDSDGYGEEYCDQRPLYTLCDHCRDESGERVDWPCPTIQALDSARAARRDEENQ